MFKKKIIILSVVVLIGLGLNLGLKQIFAQKYYQQEPAAADVYGELELIGNKLDKALALLGAADNKEILKKLDQILQEQALIKEELRIIKIRATRR
ncbi:MAG: hypothetical protein ABIH40_03820 [Candidatus Omnitrophota bacterium]